MSIADVLSRPHLALRHWFLTERVPVYVRPSSFIESRDKNAKKVKNNNVLVPHKSAQIAVYTGICPHTGVKKSKARSKRSGDGSDAPEVTTTTGVANRKELGDVDYEIRRSEVMLSAASSTATVFESL